MEKLFTEINTSDLLKLPEDPGTKILDIRPVESYNGWQFLGKKRGGHIKNAKNLPYKWTNYPDWIEVVRHKGIYPDDRIVIYGFDKMEIESVADRFIRSGYNDIHVYYPFIEEWTANSDLPMENLKRFDRLVSAEWVNNLISGVSPGHYRNDKFVILHAHYRNREAYLSGHIPGAIDMDSLSLEAPETWNRRDPGELKKALEEHGITADTTVVLYGKHMFPNNDAPFPGSAAGEIGAIPCAFIMMYAGVKDVGILNGGYQSWLDAGYEETFEDIAKTPVEDFGASIPVHLELAVDTAEAKKMITSKDSELVCVRSYREYILDAKRDCSRQTVGGLSGAMTRKILMKLVFRK